MELRQDIINKTMELLHTMEQVTGYYPDENYYNNILESLNKVDEEKLPGKFVEITNIIMQSIDQATHDVINIKQGSLKREESIIRGKELDEIASILNF